MSDPVSQAFLVEILKQIEDRFDDAHGRVRQSLNELRVEMRVGFERSAARSDALDARLQEHSERLAVMLAQREVERRALATRKRDTRDRNMLAATLTSIVVTVVIFIIKAAMHW